MGGNASILWSVPPRIELVPTPDPELGVGVLSHSEWDGSLLRVIEFSESELKVVPSSYAHLAAARRGIGTGDPLFLAVTGVTLIGVGVVLGKRALNVTDGGTWEFAPSGGVQKLPLEHQILTEATEELGVPASAVLIGDPIALYADTQAFTADVVIPLRISINVAQFMSSFVSGEYEKVEVVGITEVEAFLRRESPNFSAVTGFIVNLIKEGKLDSFV